ncbi:MAG: ABC transporter ATP-binding protein [Chloroflexi bacterium]|nr:ABC transporter ATP-binding protein [Chloroflexota bacterium]
MLRIENVAVTYGRIQALRGVSLQLAAGQFTGLLGANGAGKSTLLRAITGATPVQSGQIHLENVDITGHASFRIASHGVAIVPEGRQLFGPLTVLEHLELGAYRRVGREPASSIRQTMQWVFDIFPLLAERRKQLAATLSGGEQQMLAIGRALMAKPKLLLLDEPSLGLAPLIVAEIFRVLRDLHRTGLTILLVEQDVRITLGITSKIYVLHLGELVLQGQSADLARDGTVERFYLGAST